MTGETAGREPVAELDRRFGSPDAQPTPWADGRRRLEAAQAYWISTVRPDGRPHVTPMAGVVLDGALYFTTGPTEQKGRNLVRHPHCVVTAGTSAMEDIDVVLEGEALRVTDRPTLERLAERYAAKYPGLFHFTVRDGVFEGEGGESVVYRLDARKGFAFGKGETFSQTRWRF